MARKRGASILMADTSKFSMDGPFRRAARLAGTALAAVLFVMTAVTEVRASPNILTVLRKSPTTETTSADTLTWLITFSEPVAHETNPPPTPPDGVSLIDFVVDTTDFVVSGTTATFTIEPTKDSLDGEGCSETWDATLSGGNLADLNGTVTLAPVKDSEIGIWGCLGSGEEMTHAGPNGTNDNTFIVSNDGTAPVPEIGVSAGSAVTEGESAVFTLTAVPDPSSDITVNVSVAQDGDFGVQIGNRTVQLTPSSNSATLTVSTADDGVDEPDGSITVTVKTGSGYTVAQSAEATVDVEDDDETDDTSDDKTDDTSNGLLPQTSQQDDGAEQETTGSEKEETSPDREALSAIYRAAGGDGWRENGNWNSSRPVGTWYGVTVGPDNGVTELRLGNNGLSGTIAVETGKLGKLEVLHLNDNSLTGAVPTAELGSLSSLKELALWGNSGLAGVIPDRLGKKADRAALRTLNEVNGGSALEGWFPRGETDVFSYSGWSGVTANENGRVTGLDLSGSGLSGEVTGALSALSALERLDLSDNPGLRGELPAGLMDTALAELDISGTGVCAPAEEGFGTWLSGLDFTPNENCGGNGAEPAGENGGGGCALVSRGSGRGVQSALAVFAVIAILGRAGLRKGRKKSVFPPGFLSG